MTFAIFPSRSELALSNADEIKEPNPRGFIWAIERY
jgi:hypothetical protein